MYRPSSIHQVTPPIHRYLRDKHLPPPVVVGGVGGSGTRLVVQLLQGLGVSMGRHLNESKDAMPFVPVYDNHINNYLKGSINPTKLVDELLIALLDHQSPSPDAGLWGWKNPRSIYLLPLLDELFEGMRFIHVVRDGLAMSTSGNQTQLEKHGKHVIPQHLQALPQAEQSLLLWSIVNNAAADYGAQMGDRYFLLRYEDVCDNPSGSTAALALALNIKFPKVLNLPINSPRRRDHHDMTKMSKTTVSIASKALQRFGYIC